MCLWTNTSGGVILHTVLFPYIYKAHVPLNGELWYKSKSKFLNWRHISPCFDKTGPHLISATLPSAGSSSSSEQSPPRRSKSDLASSNSSCSSRIFTRLRSVQHIVKFTEHCVALGSWDASISARDVIERTALRASTGMHATLYWPQQSLRVASYKLRKIRSILMCMPSITAISVSCKFTTET